MDETLVELFIQTFPQLSQVEIREIYASTRFDSLRTLKLLEDKWRAAGNAHTPTATPEQAFPSLLQASSQESSEWNLNAPEFTFQPSSSSELYSPELVTESKGGTKYTKVAMPRPDPPQVKPKQNSWNAVVGDYTTGLAASRLQTVIKAFPGVQDVGLIENVFTAQKENPKAAIQALRELFPEEYRQDCDATIVKPREEAKVKITIPESDPTVALPNAMIPQMENDEYNRQLRYLEHEYHLKRFYDKVLRVAVQARDRDKINECRQAQAYHYENYRQVAETIFEETFRRKNQQKNTLKTVDLHGLLLPEALVVVQATIANIKTTYKTSGPDSLEMQRGVAILEIITGQGLHSENGAVLRPQVIEYLQSNGIMFTENPGSLITRIRV